MDLNRVDLNLLVALDALLSERSVTGAAARLSVGQSAMSSTLGRLRKLLDDPLLVREGRVLVATPLAEALEVPVRDALSRVQSILSTGRRFDPSHDERAFTLMASDYVAMTFLHPLLGRLFLEAPHVRLRVRPWAKDFEDQLRRRQVEVAVMPREMFPTYQAYRSEVLFRDRWVCAVDKDHPEVGERITFEQFTRLPYLATSAGSDPSLIETQLDRMGIERRTELTAGFDVAPFLLRGTHLITLIPQRLADRLRHLAEIRLVEPPLKLEPITETMLWTSSSDDDPGHRWLRQCLVDLASGMNAESPYP